MKKWNNQYNQSIFTSSLNNPTSQLVDNCLKQVENSLWTCFAPVNTADIFVKNPYPKCNIYTHSSYPTQEDAEQKKNNRTILRIEVSLPFASEGNISIEANDETNTISLTVENTQVVDYLDVAYLWRDIPRGKIKQEFTLPSEYYSVKDVKADLSYGVLTLTLNRKTPLVEQQPSIRKIKIG